MLVISGGPRTDTGHQYQLHQMDTHKFMGGLTKATFRITCHDEVVPTLFEAFRVATSGEPGPVFVELPVNIMLLTEEIGELPVYQPPVPEPVAAPAELARAVELLAKSRRPCIFVGGGAAGCDRGGRGSRRMARCTHGDDLAGACRPSPAIIRCMSASGSAHPRYPRRRKPSRGAIA
jgi:acetolactate synthase-1/2/3 large subunit